MEKDKDFLGTEPIGKLLLRLAIPTLAAQLINMLYNVVDRIYIGHIPKVGALALTGVGVCMPLIMIVSAFAVLVGNGGAPRASIYMGQNNKEDAEKTLGNCFAAQILVAIVLTIVLLFGNRTFLLAFGASENTISYAAAYMNIYAVGTIFVQLTLGLNAFITAQGFAKTGMLSVLIGAVINIVLDPRARRSACNNHITGMLLYLGRQLLIWKEDIFKDTKKEYEAGSKNYITKSCAGTRNIYYAGE